MSRVMHGGEEAAYRTVVIVVWPSGEESTGYAGPFANVGTANAVFTREQRSQGSWARYRRELVPAVTGYVERSTYAWERV